MARLTADEFETLIELLSGRLGLGKLHSRLLRAGALVSRKQPVSVSALARRLYQLTSGLGRDHPARVGLELLWREDMAERMDDDGNRQIEAIGGRINACIEGDRHVVPGKRDDLLAALEDYYRVQRAAAGDEAAYLEMVMRAVPAVAEIVRNNRGRWRAQEASPASSPVGAPSGQEDPGGSRA